MKTIQIGNILRNSFKEDKPVQTYLDLEIKSGCKGRTLQRKIKLCNLLASYNKNSKFYTLPKLAKFNNYGIWSYRHILFSRHGNLYRTLIYIVDQSKCGYTGKELSVIVQVKTDDALRVLWQQERLQRQKHNSHYVYYTIEQQRFELQQANRIQSSNLPQIYCLPDDQNIIISVLVEIIHQDTLTTKVLYKRLKGHKVEISENQIGSVISHYGLKKKNSKF